MKTTLDLPNDLVREIKLRAVNEGRKLKDLIADLLRQGLGSGGSFVPPVRPQKGEIKLPLFPSANEAPASRMTIGEIIAMEQETQTREDLERLRLLLFDVGVWVALAFSTHPHHPAARKAFDAADLGHPAAFCRATQTSFLRLITTPAIQKFYGSPPITNAEAWAKCEELMALPQVVWLTESPGLESEWKKCACLTSASPKVWMDAYLAAFAIAGSLRMVTLDQDFRHFEEHGLQLQLLTLEPSEQPCAR